MLTVTPISLAAISTSLKAAATTRSCVLHSLNWYRQDGYCLTHPTGCNLARQNELKFA